MEKTKTCKNCQTEKSPTDFSKGKAVCKSCRANQRRINYKIKKTLEHISPIIQDAKFYEKEFIDHVNEFSEYLNQHGGQDLIIIEETMKKLLRVYENMVIQNNFIEIPITISDNLKNYLVNVRRYCGSGVSAAMSVFSEPMVNFPLVFGNDQNTIYELIYYELADLECVINVIEKSCCILIQLHNEKIDQFHENDRIEDPPIVDFNEDHSIIEVSNIFRHTKEQFLENLRMVEIHHRKNIYARAQIESGHLQKFWKILDIPDNEKEQFLDKNEK